MKDCEKIIEIHLNIKNSYADKYRKPAINKKSNHPKDKLTKDIDEEMQTANEQEKKSSISVVTQEILLKIALTCFFPLRLVK